MKKILIQTGCDALVLMGGIAFIHGLSLAWLPLGFIGGGLLLGAAAFFYSYGTRKAE